MALPAADHDGRGASHALCFELDAVDRLGRSLALFRSHARYAAPDAVVEGASWFPSMEMDSGARVFMTALPWRARENGNARSVDVKSMSLDARS